MHDDFYIDPDLVEATCLAHDLGNPPFGHAGERTLHMMMGNCGGFEGNAQSLRLVTEMFYGTMTDKKGMKPTRAFADGLLKYKEFYSTGEKAPENKFLYRDQAKYLDFVYCGEDWKRQKGKLTRSIECQIMDWSDNVAYSIDDLKDAISAGLITSQAVNEWTGGTKGLLEDAKEKLKTLAGAIEKSSSDEHLSRRMGELIGGLSIEPAEGFMSQRSNRHRFRLKVDENMEAEYRAYRDLAKGVVFFTARIQQLESKGDYILRKLFRRLDENYSSAKPLHLFPEDWHTYVTGLKIGEERQRTICDFLAGMTDAFAGRYFQRFFLPEYGSLTDLV